MPKANNLKELIEAEDTLQLVNDELEALRDGEIVTAETGGGVKLLVKFDDSV
jgi:frataxin-like iron-binding protein CyaY